MREDWNARAREDAHYYVAFGQRDQDDEGFFATAADVLRAIDPELKRGTPTPPDARRFLEIGCGPGRLMRPMSERCGEIHGIDVSDEMIARARRNLARIPHAHLHVGTGSALDLFPDNHFDFVYSYAVFQHIPSRDVVFSYLRETVRVLKPGGIARLQINGLPKDAKEYTTWAGVRISGDEIREFAREHGIQLLALEPLNTQYMWTTWCKTALGPPSTTPAIVRVTNAFTSEPLVPISGRYAAVSLWVDDLDDSVDLNNLQLSIDGLIATLTYIGREEAGGMRQLNALIPAGLHAGIATIELHGASKPVRLLPIPPAVPRIISVTDGVDLLSENRATSGWIKLTVEEFGQIETLVASLGGQNISNIETFCVDPMPPRHEINLQIPENTAFGDHVLRLNLNGREISSVVVTVL